MLIKYDASPLFCEVCRCNRDMPGWLPRAESVPEAAGEFDLSDDAPCVALCRDCAARMTGELA